MLLIDNRKYFDYLLFCLIVVKIYKLCFSGVIINRETAEHRNDTGKLFIDILKQKVILDIILYVE